MRQEAIRPELRAQRELGSTLKAIRTWAINSKASEMWWDKRRVVELLEDIAHETKEAVREALGDKAAPGWDANLKPLADLAGVEALAVRVTNLEAASLVRGPYVLLSAFDRLNDHVIRLDALQVELRSTVEALEAKFQPDDVVDTLKREVQAMDRALFAPDGHHETALIDRLSDVPTRLADLEHTVRRLERRRVRVSWQPDEPADIPLDEEDGVG